VAWTTDDLLAAIKRKANLPSGANAKFSDANLLDFAYQAMIVRVDPILTNLREEYGVARVDLPVTPSVATYVLPERAVSGTIRQVLCVPPGGTPYPLPRIAEAEAWKYEYAAGASLPSGFAIEDDTIRLLPTPTTAGVTLRVSYRRRPSRLVLVSSCAVITSWDAGTFVVYATGGTWAPGPASNIIDVVRARPPFGVLAESISTAYSFASFQGAFGASFFDRVAVGDYVCHENTTCVVPVPERYQTLLLDYAAAEILSAWGDRDGAAIVWAAADRYVDALNAAQSNRVETSPQIVIQRANSLRGAFGFGWRR
jgi:hypothetical protein